MMQISDTLDQLALSSKKVHADEKISTFAETESADMPSPTKSESNISSDFDNSFELSTHSSSIPSLQHFPIKLHWIDLYMNKFFHMNGRLVAEYPKTVLAITLIFTLICSSKILVTPQKDDLKTGYTPVGAPSLTELSRREQFFETTGIPLTVAIFLTALDGGSMSRISHLNESIKILDIIGNDFPIGTKQQKNFFQICTDFCLFNEPVRQFRNGLLLKSMSTPGSIDNLGTRINLTFPFINMLGTGMDLSPNFFGLKLNNTEDPFRVTNIDDLKLVILQFRADPSENMNRDDVLAWERTVGHYFNNKFKGQFVETKTLSITFIGDEIVRTGMTLFPFISVGFVIMSIFSIVTVYMSAYYFDQWTKHKISMALMAGVCPLLATSTALGFLFWCGFRFGSILCVTPFLVMAIGVDDAYLMIHSWQRICVKRQAEKKKHIQEHDSNYYSLAERIAEVTVDVGPSITITSLTNVLAFGVGTFAPTPEIQLFCYANVVAIFIDYIYQMTMFLAIIAIAGDYEIAMEKDRPTKTGEVNVNLKRRAMSFMKAYCKWLSNPFTSLIIIFVMAFYLTWSIQATMSIGVKLTPDKLFLHDSTILKINRLRDNYVVPNYLAISLFVNNASNLEDPAKEKRLEQMINEFETMDESLGFKYSKYWKRDYEGFVNILSEDPEMSFENEISKDSKAVSVNSLYSRKSIHQFVNWPEYKHWGGFIRFDNHTDTISKFFISLAYKSEGFKSWNFRGVMLSKWRAITKKYPELDATIYYEDASFLDQIDTLIPATVSSSIWTLICMAIVCIFFMKNVFTVVVASLAITSICVGVFGCLAAWGIDLDPISMATTIMSIGFSVDFPAHISYHYYRCGVETGFKLSIEHRILDALIAIGFPLLQCAISTILFVTCLLFIDTYMSEVFVKTMVLVVSLGLVHALIVVPSFLCMLSNLNMAVFGNENKDEEIVSKKSSLCQSFKALFKSNRKSHTILPSKNLEVMVPNGIYIDKQGKVSVQITNSIK